MAAELDGLRALVTGAGQGIGRSIALSFAQEGAEVLAVSRTGAKMQDLAALGPKITPLALDVADRAAVTQAAPSFGPLDILVNCAGWVHDGTILDCDEDDWERSMAVNVTAAYRLIRIVLPGMIERRRGSIINVASVASSITGVARRAAYGASKAALVGLTKGVARDVVGHNVRVNALCPGTTDSPSLAARIEATPDPAATRRAFVERQPMKRLGQPDEIAAGALFLASGASSFMTGQLLVLDGGQTM